MSIRLGILLWLFLGMTACILNPEPFIDSKRDAEGNIVILDTERNFNDFAEIVMRRVQREKDGLSPPDSNTTWNEFWNWSIDGLNDGVGYQNPERYVTFIIEQRQAAGLPPLEP